jgi:hypothetical protein
MGTNSQVNIFYQEFFSFVILYIIECQGSLNNTIDSSLLLFWQVSWFFSDSDSSSLSVLIRFIGKERLESSSKQNN